MKFGVVVFPGSNCDRDMIHVLQDVMGHEVLPLWHKQSDLSGLTTADCIVLPGGFSYGDYLRTGAIARFSPIMQAVIEHGRKGGLLFGICNGFQVLCETGLLPGALLRNESQNFICKNVHLRAEGADSLLTKGLEVGSTYTIPIAHADGRYYAPEHVVEQLQEQNRVLFSYCNAEGEVAIPSNPNGSVENIAGICNEEGNIAGMMPHPERAAESDLGNTDGLAILRSLERFALASNEL